MSQIVAPTVSVNNTTGYWTYAYSSQPNGYLLLGFSYQYRLVLSELAYLSADGAPLENQTANINATVNLNAVIPDDVELLIGGTHFARYRVSGSISGSWDLSANKYAYIFSYGKLLKTPVLVPANNNIQLVSKINAFWSNLYASISTYVLVCSLMPNTARLVIA
jgi:hypothetical protein